MNIKRIVILGGSFNPPTIAHDRLMTASIEALQADLGIFVPVGQPYLKRKMRGSADHICLEEPLRLAMVQAMCADDPRLQVSDVEMRDPLLYTRQTLSLMRDAWPEAQLYFLAGADKLAQISHWAKTPGFFDRTSIALFTRDGLNPTVAIHQDEHLSAIADHFVTIRQPEGTEGVSSTAVRHCLLNGDLLAARPMLHKAVWPLFAPLRAADYPAPIEKFQGAYEFLSNAFSVPVTLDGLTFPCAEAAFQALRFDDPAIRALFIRCDAARAKTLAAKRIPNVTQSDEQLMLMERVLAAKFTQNPQLLDLLNATGRAELINGRNAKDSFWGRNLYTDRGDNQLGRLLMKLRRQP